MRLPFTYKISDLLIRKNFEALEGLTIVGGLIDGAGGFPQIGPGWSATRSALGIFVVTFNPALKEVPVVVVSAASSAASSGNHAGLDHTALPTKASFGVKCTDASSTLFVNIFWSFLAVIIP